MFGGIKVWTTSGSCRRCICCHPFCLYKLIGMKDTPIKKNTESARDHLFTGRSKPSSSFSSQDSWTLLHAPMYCTCRQHILCSSVRCYLCKWGANVPVNHIFASSLQCRWFAHDLQRFSFASLCWHHSALKIWLQQAAGKQISVKSTHPPTWGLTFTLKHQPVFFCRGTSRMPLPGTLSKLREIRMVFDIMTIRLPTR